MSTHSTQPADRAQRSERPTDVDSHSRTHPDAAGEDQGGSQVLDPAAVAERYGVDASGIKPEHVYRERILFNPRVCSRCGRRRREDVYWLVEAEQSEPFEQSARWTAVEEAGPGDSHAVFRASEPTDDADTCFPPRTSEAAAYVARARGHRSDADRRNGETSAGALSDLAATPEPTRVCPCGAVDDEAPVTETLSKSEASEIAVRVAARLKEQNVAVDVEELHGMVKHLKSRPAISSHDHDVVFAYAVEVGVAKARGVAPRRLKHSPDGDYTFTDFPASEVPWPCPNESSD